MEIPITLVPFDTRHLDKVAEIERECYSTPWSRTLFESELRNPQATWFVAEADGFVAGYAGLINISGEGHLTNIAVRPDLQRRKIGERLLKKLLESARTQKAEFVTLEVRESGSAARALYEKFGFKVVGRRPRYYEKPEEDAILMTLNFTNGEDRNEYIGD